MLRTRQAGVSAWSSTSPPSPLRMGCWGEQPSARGADLAHSSALQLGAVPCHGREGLTGRGMGFVTRLRSCCLPQPSCRAQPATQSRGDPSAPRVPRPQLRDALRSKGLRGSQTQRPALITAGGRETQARGTHVRGAGHAPGGRRDGSGAGGRLQGTEGSHALPGQASHPSPPKDGPAPLAAGRAPPPGLGLPAEPRPVPGSGTHRLCGLQKGEVGGGHLLFFLQSKATAGPVNSRARCQPGRGRRPGQPALPAARPPRLKPQPG